MARTSSSLVSGALYLPHISPIPPPSPPHLAHISPTSRPYLPCISPGEWGLGWRAFVLLDAANPEALPLHDGCLETRPEYAWLDMPEPEAQSQP